MPVPPPDSPAVEPLKVILETRLVPSVPPLGVAFWPLDLPGVPHANAVAGVKARTPAIVVETIHRR
jgi:hypothetical protein